VRLQSGDRHAFDQLYTRYYDRVYAYARVALGDPHEAEDVTQQVFANAIQALPRYQVRDDFPFRGWLFRIARNNVYRALSRNGRARAEEPEQLDRRLEMTTAEDVADVDWLSDNDLAVLVERLPLAQRQVILLRYLFEMRTDEIAKALDRSPVSVRMLEHRAIRALEARLLAMKAKRPAQRA
jgi:RNA polymerase sigma-70 factor (ECF subfamily)